MPVCENLWITHAVLMVGINNQSYKDDYIRLQFGVNKVQNGVPSLKNGQYPIDEAVSIAWFWEFGGSLI